MNECYFCGASGNTAHIASIKVRGRRDGVRIQKKKTILLPEEVVMRRFIWLKGNRKGELLERYEIEALGMFLPGGALYGKEDDYKW